MSLHRNTIQETAAQSPVTAGSDKPAAEASPNSATTTGRAKNPTKRWPPRGRRPMRAVVAVSLVAGLAAAAAGVALSAGGTEPVVDGLVLVGFAAGWALLLVLSVRFTDRPQRWAGVPAAVMGVGGTALLVVRPSSAALDTLGWVWPPALLGLLAWITIRIRRQLPRRGGRWLLYPVIAVTTLAASGGGYHTVSQAIDQASATPGQLIDVGDHRLYLSCTGSGEPTVVLQPGLGETSAAWGWIAPAVAAHTRVCVYDRAGRGRSETAPAAQDGNQISADLHTLLDRAHITGPVVMAGHSVGGLYVLDYAARYPQQVAGMVLLDTTPPTAFTSLPDYPGIYQMLRTATGLFPGLARIGVNSLVNASSHTGLPAQAREQARTDASAARQARSQRDELAMVPTMMAQARAVTDLGDLPLYVLTAPVDSQTGWLSAQTALAALSRNSIHLVVAGAEHQALLDSESAAAVSGQAIIRVVDAARTGTPLTGS